MASPRRTSWRLQMMNSLLHLQVVALLLAQAEGGFMSAPRKPTLAKSDALSKTKPGAITLRTLPDALSTIGLPAAAYAGLAGTTFGAFKLLAGAAAPSAAVLPLGLLGFSIGVPVALTTGMLAATGGPGVAQRMGGFPADNALVDLARSAAEAVDVKPPQHVFEIPATEPNAFAASGIRGSSTTVAVTTGLRKLLTQDELAAVLAHEMGHLRHRDVARNMHVAIASAGLGGIYEAGRMLIDSSRRSRKSGKDKKNEKDSSAGVGLSLMGLGLVSQGVAHLVQMGASRGAELRADRTAAEAVGADSLIRALRKIDESAARQPADLRQSSTGKKMAFAMISDGPSASVAASKTSHNGWRRALGRIGQALRTHPTLDTRIAALEEAVASGEVPRSGKSTFSW